MKYSPILLAIIGAFSFCQKAEKRADAYGNFEAVETIVSAESTGRILELKIEEGQDVAAGQTVGLVESGQLALKRQQLVAAMAAVRAKSPDVDAQLRVFEKQLAVQNQQMANLLKEKARVDNLVKEKAVTTKTLDDLNYQIEVLKKQMDATAEQRAAQNAGLSTQKTGLLAEIEPLQKQIAQLDDQTARAKITAPVGGTVLAKFAQTGEMAVAGRALFKLADLKRMTLRAFVSGEQLGSVKIGQTVKIKTDAPGGAMAERDGKVTWISSKAEFTPKVIQTKDERVSLVYAVKIEVDNADGSLKIGMPAEVDF